MSRRINICSGSWSEKGAPSARSEGQGSRYLCVCVCVCARAGARVCDCVCICLCLFVCMRACMYVCIQVVVCVGAREPVRARKYCRITRSSPCIYFAGLQTYTCSLMYTYS